MRHYFEEKNPLDETGILNSINQHAQPLKNVKDLQPLLDRIGDAKIVMLGEASHGTHEYYTWRAQLSKKLIEEKGFNFIAVEGDWPDCYRLNRFIKGYDTDSKNVFKVLHEVPNRMHWWQ
ncbi:hypothetical protein SAMN04487898_12132 [Pedobacter sp. ok626]|uniref:erythromycin esterase family protein n=1 Tax=Pedobacter sp. ok626 TaxID=1761882 RepID=UPI0008883B03|nr:erythromycin esterase family protein [Pedobacter sp. ok626]SDL58979.1 hypothetical protein SAMN04487898_12132 [Pedobacter sp. ok626]